MSHWSTNLFKILIDTQVTTSFKTQLNLWENSHLSNALQYRPWEVITCCHGALQYWSLERHFGGVAHQCFGSQRISPDFFSFWHQMIYSNDNMRIVHLIPFLSEQVLPKPCGWGWVWPEYHHWLFSFWFWPQSHLSYIVPGHIHARLQPLLFESPHSFGSPET